MQSTVIELSRSSSDDKPSNSEWTSKLSTPVTVNNGDYVMVKQAFIDTRLIDNNSILIEKEVQWTLQFMYWVNNAGINTKSMTNNYQSVIPDGLPYVLMCACQPTDANYNLRFGRPVVDDFTITIPAGIYERSYFAEFISRQLQKINRPPRSKNQSVVFSNDTVLPIYDTNNNFTGFTKSAPGARQNVITSFQRPVTLGNFNNQGGEDPTPPPYPNSIFYRDSNNALFQGFFYPLTDSGAYALNDHSLCLVIRPGEGGSSGQYTVDIGGVNKLFDVHEGGFIGASEVALVYNDSNGDSRFSFQYMHSPIVSNGNESVGTWINNTDNILNDTETTYLTAYSGIMLVNTYTNLSDDNKNDPFLTQLGFSYEDLVSPNIQNYFKNNNRVLTTDTYVPLSYYNDFLPYTTRNMMTMGDINDGYQVTLGSYQVSAYESVYTSQAYGNQTSQYFLQNSTITEPIKATNPPISSNSNGGHYLIELQCSYDNEFIGQDKNYQVKAVVGNYFLSGDSFAMSMGPDSFIYQHQGEPVALASIKVRILNPITHESEPNLGQNSTIYLQVTKEPPQPTTKDESPKKQ